MASTKQAPHEAHHAQHQLNGSVGGLARAKKLTPAERSAIARDAARGRWSKQKLQERFSGALTIGSIELPCAVLDTSQRVLTKTGIANAFSTSKKSPNTPAQDGELRPPAFLASTGIALHVSDSLRDKLANPLIYTNKQGILVHGYEAEVLPEICEAILDAHTAGDLKPNQLRIFDAAKALYKGLARIGIIGLVDEATGYQAERARDELARILEAYISAELLPWTKTFPDEFFRGVYKIHGWQFKEGTARPLYVGKFINRYVYDALPPGVLAELRERNPVQDNGRRRHKHFQHLTKTIGHPQLEEQIKQVITLLRISENKREFNRHYEKLHPQVGTQQPLPLDDWQDEVE